MSSSCFCLVHSSFNAYPNLLFKRIMALPQHSGRSFECYRNPRRTRSVPLTRSFADIVAARIRRDPVFRAALIAEAKAASLVIIEKLAQTENLKSNPGIH